MGFRKLRDKTDRLPHRGLITQRNSELSPDRALVEEPRHGQQAGLAGRRAGLHDGVLCAAIRAGAVPGGVARKRGRRPGWWFGDDWRSARWASGRSLSYLKELVLYWQRSFDWRAQEA